MAAWAATCAAIAGSELAVFAESESAARAPVHPDPRVQARTIFANAARYLAMAAGFGVSAFQEPRPALSWLDPWWLAGAAAVVALGARAIAGFARGREEAAWWSGAAAAFLPVSQIFPFLYPVADRYLYFMLPGLIGGALLAGREPARGWAPRTRRRAALALGAMTLIGVTWLGAASRSRAALWTSENRVLDDAALHHPGGVAANLIAARRAASAGDVEGAIELLEACRARGWDYYRILLDPNQREWEPVRSDPRFQALIARIADGAIAETERRARLTQMELWDLASAYRLRERWPDALAALERARAVGGPLDPELPDEMTKVRIEQARAARAHRKSQ
jgi:hypothetical protein